MGWVRQTDSHWLRRGVASVAAEARIVVCRIEVCMTEVCMIEVYTTADRTKAAGRKEMVAVGLAWAY